MDEKKGQWAEVADEGIVPRPDDHDDATTDGGAPRTDDLRDAGQHGGAQRDIAP
jgi:hypothetical protein